ncbi:TMEM175 family protein [Streptacidiphilus melanogenes]|uniref:TMEM175 family protein n=1 Tax=Streptacidiphilus melanogenes TaxID=411235 RepID=UPI0005A7CBF0|nr:TMEM175 family protein [Streptacidiphilus melanogenes]
MSAQASGAAEEGSGHGSERDAEGSPERLIALSDGIYAIAMTLLVLDVQVPDGLDPAGFRHAISHLWAQLGAYVWSFYIIGAFWRDQRKLFLRMRRVDTTVLRLTLAALGAIALLPFPTALLAEYREQSLAVALYAAAITIAVALHISIATTVWRREHLQARHITDELGRSVIRDLSATAIVFGVSVPVAFVSPHAAVGVWLLLIPAKFVTGRRLRAARR